MRAVKKNATVSLRVPDADKEELEREARRQGLCPSEYTRRALEVGFAYLKAHGIDGASCPRQPASDRT